MKPQKRCKRISVESWKAPGGTGSDLGQQHREMEGRCTEPLGHEGRHIFGDWLERKAWGTGIGRDRVA